MWWAAPAIIAAAVCISAAESGTNSHANIAGALARRGSKNNLSKSSKPNIDTSRPVHRRQD
eukprot:703826-Amphidinium_carterae.1